MDKMGWQYTAIILGSVLFLSNAAQFHTRRVLENELASAQKALADADNGGSLDDMAHAGVVSIGPILAGSSPVVVSEERCMSGRRYAKIDGVWHDLPGSC